MEVFLQLLLYPPPPSPPKYRPTRLVGEKIPTDLSRVFGTVSVQNSIKGRKKQLQRPGFISVFRHFCIENEVILKFLLIKKEWSYNL